MPIEMTCEVWIVLHGTKISQIEDFKGAVMQIEKALINDRFRVSKVS